MSQFSDMFMEFAAPSHAEWFGGSIEYRSVDLAEGNPGKAVEFALVGDERTQRRRQGEYTTQLVKVRQVKLNITKDTPTYSGVANPQQNATVVIIENGEAEVYTVETVVGGLMTDLNLKFIKRVELGTRESLGE